MTRYNSPVKRTSVLTALAVALFCASSALNVTARAQQAARPPAASAAAPSAPRAARPAPVYRVELVVFRATSGLGAPEDWAIESGTSPTASTDADPGSAPSGTTPTNGAPAAGEAPNGAVRTLTASEFQLEDVASRLRASGRYVPVAHVAWAQTASPWGKPMEIPVQSVGLDAQGITGTVALERGVYLHLALKLRYTMSDPPDGLEAPPGTVFVLDESQRVRLKERNYFDHPAFGVIALVTSDQATSRTGR